MQNEKWAPRCPNCGNGVLALGPQETKEPDLSKICIACINCGFGGNLFEKIPMIYVRL